MLLEATDGWRNTEPLNPQVAQAIATEARASIKLAPAFAEPHHVLAQLSLAMRRDMEEGLKMAQRAVLLDWRNREFRLTLARFYAARSDYKAAIETLDTILAWPVVEYWTRDAGVLRKRIESDVRTGKNAERLYLPRPMRR